MMQDNRILYRSLSHPRIFEDMTDLISRAEAGFLTPEDRPCLCAVVNGLLELAAAHGFCGNLWHSYLAYELAENENAFSLACEGRGMADGSIVAFACQDLGVFKRLFDCSLDSIDRACQTDLMALITHYTGSGVEGRVFSRWVRDRIQDLSIHLAAAFTAEDCLAVLTDFYRKCGAGELGLHRAFRIRGKGLEARLEPITSTEHCYLKDIIGYESQKARLTENTEAFLADRPANNCLLYGDSGTGKSSSIKALMNEYYDQGLRMIEVYKHQLKELPYVIGQIKDRNYKFILLMDDLSFEDFEVEYKYLKAIIEGGLEKRPDNVLIYATSNRRHLIREKYSDKRERQDDLHGNDTVQEKLSLVARFGIQIYFGAPERKAFQEIVCKLAARYQIDIPQEQLLLEANAWELHHGGLSGRTALQFIMHLSGVRK